MAPEAYMLAAQTRLLTAVRTAIRQIGLETEERKMFGGTTFMHRGNMLCCVARQGLMLRVGAAQEDHALTRPFAQPCMGTGRRMAGFIMVEHAAFEDDATVRDWLDMARNYVAALPSKATQQSTKQPKSKHP